MPGRTEIESAGQPSVIAAALDGPPADPPYYRVRHEASDKPGELAYAVNSTVWVPPGVRALRGVVVHQHGCGEGSCKSGLTGAYDLHWQALPRKHDCALLSPAYEQPEGADCQLWCDPRNGSDAAFRKGLADLGAESGHPELAKVPWALCGHSGGGHWAGGMVMLHPDRVAAAWLRSGVPLLKGDPTRKGSKAHALPDAALRVPVMCNLGTREGVTAKDRNFAGVWPATEAFFAEVRGRGGLAGVAVDPLSSHDCGNQPEQGKNPFGRPVFQNLQYSDTPTQPLVPMQFTDAGAEPGKTHAYRVIAVNTVGLKSRPSAAAVPKP
ncbi:MAG: hypothetical protein J2P46_14890 [Zavarzinella sp.]|nr:hypothetical protein [Zavarzinella sp.]